MAGYDKHHGIPSPFILLSSLILSSLILSPFASSNPHSRDRGQEIEKTCAHFLASSSPIDVFNTRIHRTKTELSFFNGDWNQDSGVAPLMPFIHYNNISSILKSASFVVNTISNPHHQHPTSNHLLIGATLLLKTSQFVDSNRRFFSPTGFRYSRGRSQLVISFRGIYMENKAGGRTLCLLGETDLPLRHLGALNPWKLFFLSNNQNAILPDDRILLLLRYPTVFNLISRWISGEMYSLNLRTSPRFFDRVRVSSQLSRGATYEFGSERILKRACDPYPFRDDFMDSDMDMYKGGDFCSVLHSLNENGVFSVLPNWRCTGRDDFCSRLGPFASDESISSTHGGFGGVKLLFKDLRCVYDDEEEGRSARVSGVFRSVSPAERVVEAGSRTGLGNTTLSVEGFWKSHGGQLCMVGCSTVLDEEGDTCNSRISLYISFAFSIRRRSAMFGTIRSIDSGGRGSHFPLSFEKHARPSTALIPFRPRYRYSKIESAGAVLERHEPFGFGTVIKTSLLTFPRLGNLKERSRMYDLHLLSRDLTLHLSGVSNSSRFDLMIQIISIGRLFGLDWRGSGTHDSTEITENQLLLNVSADMSVVDGREHSNFSSLSLEGLYDSHLGKMYLIGCRDVRASWSVLHESMDLEDGLDCLIEVVVSYPPTNSHGLMNPTAGISIASQRNLDDPLYFPNVNFKVSPVIYINQQKDVLLRRHVEGALRIFTLSVAMSSVLSQLYYMTLNSDSAPYISLVMLFVEAAGYSIPLVTGAEAILKKNYDRGGLYSVSRSSQWLNTVDYTVNVLCLLNLIMILRLSQKVCKSRARLRSQDGGSANSPVLGERLVLVVTVIAHLVGYGAVLGFRYVFLSMSVKPTRDSGVLSGWKTELLRYLGLVQDLFLLPQIIGNIAWNVVCKPLRPTFFVGITFVRILPHVYDFVVIPSFDDRYSIHYGKFADTGFDFYSKFDDVLIPVAALLLALVVYIQQKWDLQMVNLLWFREGGVFHSASKEYQRVGTNLCESELISTTPIDEGGEEASPTK